MKVVYCCLIMVLVMLAGMTQGGLVAYWPLDEGTGQGVADSSGAGNGGVLGDTGSVEGVDPSWVVDVDRGDVLEWKGNDATAQWINLTTKIDSFKSLGQGSICAWIKIPGGDAVDVILAISDSGDGSSELRFFYEGGLRFDVREDSGNPADEGGQVVSAIEVADDKWHFVAVTVDGDNNAKLYVDGVLAGSGKEPFINSVSGLDHMSLGRNIDSNGTQWVFKGRMSDVAVFDTAIGADVIQAIYNGLSVLDIDNFATGPVPVSGAGHVGMDTAVGWDKPAGVEGARYNVYFGTDADFAGGAAATGVSGTSYRPALLEAATEYFWRVDVANGGEIFEGAVWSFTTGGYVDQPLPVDGEMGVFTGTTLSWSGDATVASYDVYFAQTGNELELKGNTAATNYGGLSALEPYTEYRWRVDTLDGDGERIAAGDVWTFTTAAEGSFFDEVDVFVNGTEGYTCYRIPAILLAPNGDVLAFSEGRKNNCGDHGDVDIVMKRSKDGGATWEPLQMIYEEGDTANITIGNPCPVVDESNGRIWMPFCRNNDRVFVGYSDDNGHTWSQRREVTESVKASEWGWYATGPGVGIQLESSAYKGRLVIPSDHNYGQYGSHMMYSDDHGETWKYSERILPGCNECQAVELIDGTVMNNARTYTLDPDHRGIATSTDGGVTWSDVWFDQELPEPTCQASFLRYTRSDSEDIDRVIFSNPSHTSSRVNMTVKMSYDEADTWPVSKQIYSGAGAYSCLVVLPNWDVGCFYEKDGYKRIVLARFSIEWLTDGADTLEFCTESIVGDINGDCKVNLGDLAVMAQNWAKCYLVPVKACP